MSIYKTLIINAYNEFDTQTRNGAYYSHPALCLFPYLPDHLINVIECKRVLTANLKQILNLIIECFTPIVKKKITKSKEPTTINEKMNNIISQEQLSQLMWDMIETLQDVQMRKLEGKIDESLESRKKNIKGPKPVIDSTAKGDSLRFDGLVECAKKKESHSSTESVTNVDGINEWLIIMLHKI